MVKRSFRYCEMSKSFSLADNGLHEPRPVHELGSFAVRELVTLFEEGTINIPHYQRDSSAWSLDKKQDLILSLLRCYYIPPVTISKAGELLNLVDGLQRITSILDFIENKFYLEINKKKVYFSSTKEQSSFHLSEEDRKELERRQIGFIKYFDLDLDKEVERFYCIQNHVPLTLEQKINFNAYRNKPNLSTYIVELGIVLNQRKTLNKVLRLRNESRYPKTKYNVILGSILLAALSNKKRAKFSHTLTESQLKTLTKKEGLVKITEIFGKEGEILLKKLEELSKALYNQGKKFSTKQAFVNVFCAWFLEKRELKEVLEKFKTYRDLLEEEDAINSTIEKLNSINTFKEFTAWRNEEKIKRKELFVEFQNILGFARAKASNLDNTIEEIVEFLETGEFTS